MLKDYPDVLQVKDVVSILRVGKNAVYRLLASGEIASLRIGKKYIIPKNCILDYLERERYTRTCQQEAVMSERSADNDRKLTS